MPEATATRLGIEPLLGPAAAPAFAKHLRLAVAAAEEQDAPLTLVLLRAPAHGPRMSRRLLSALRGVRGFTYAIQQDVFAVLAPGAGETEMLAEALDVRSCVRGGMLRGGTLVEAGIASLEHGEGARGLFDRAAAALDAAEAADEGAVIASPALPLRVSAA